MATRHHVVQGDSYSYDITSVSVPTFDVNWTGKWSIVDKLGSDGTELATAALAISGDSTALEMRILPMHTETIPVGWYYLVIEVTNSSIGFNQEIMQDMFEIKPQGA